jgi:hypothetical protein
MPRAIHELQREQRLDAPPSVVFPFLVRGPYRLWHHTHELSPVDGGAATLMRDTVRYAIGFGLAGEIARRTVVRRDLEAIFAFRRERVAALLAEPSPGAPLGRS